MVPTDGAVSVSPPGHSPAPTLFHHTQAPGTGVPSSRWVWEEGRTCPGQATLPQQLWGLAGAGCPPRACRRCWGGDMLGAALGTSGRMGFRSGHSQVVPARDLRGRAGCAQAHPSR